MGLKERIGERVVVTCEAWRSLSNDKAVTKKGDILTLAEAGEIKTQSGGFCSLRQVVLRDAENEAYIGDEKDYKKYFEFLED